MTHRPGLYGKLPAVGDFIGRGFSNGLKDALDRLLQAALLAAFTEGNRARLEAGAEPIALSLRPGAIAETGFTGCVLPSVDRVGRFFPLCLGVETDPARDILPNWVSLALATALCQLGFEAQASRHGPDDLLARMPDESAWNRLMFTQTPFTADQDITVPATPVNATQFCFAGPEEAMSPMERALCSRLPIAARALGTVVAPGSHFTHYFADRSLLDWSSFAALFDRRWAHWGWSLASSVRDAADEADLATLPPPPVATDDDDDDDDDRTIRLIDRKD